MKWVVLVLALFCASCAATVGELVKEIHFTDAAYTPTKGDDRTEELEVLLKNIRELGIEVTFLPEAELELPAWGYSRPEMGVIVVDAGLEVNGRFEVLAHEAGHFFHPNFEHRVEREAFAEAVMVGVGEEFGIDLRKASAGYMAGSKNALPVMEYYRLEVKEAVKALTKR